MGAPGNSAVDAASTANADRQNQINNSVAQIHAAYNSPNRTNQINQYGTNLQDYYTGQVNNQEAVNARNLKFADARSGVVGGSAAVDSNTQLQKDFTKGLLDATQAANSGKAALTQADMNSENQLVGTAASGAYTGAIPGQVGATQAANLNSAQSYSNANALGNVFAGTAGIYQTEQIAAANRKAQQMPLGSMYGGTNTGGASPYQGP
jgi:hypothetical protein